MVRGIGGKERFYGGFSPRFEERGRRSGWGVAPPSRNLWVGNLSSHVTKNSIFEQFLRFGDIESIAYVPGRSYAFVNFKREDDAVLALRGLQGSNLAGMPLRIEFAKGDEDYREHKDERRSVERAESNLRRDLKPQPYSPEKSSDKSKCYRSTEVTEPSEELWIGFPSSLNVDDMILKRAFSPFGEIEKITSFPGRSYAFVRYKSVVAACRAKEALQGKLFNNPRVSICFARSDMPADHGKVLTNIPSPPRLKPDFLPRGSEQHIESLHGDTSFKGSKQEFRMASPQFGSTFSKVPGDSHAMHLSRNKSLHGSADPGPVGGSYFENMRLREFAPERSLEDVFERSRRSPEDRVPPWSDLPFERPQRVPPFADSRGAEDRSFPLAKKLKVDPMPDKELPEYPFLDIKQAPFSDLPVHHSYSKPMDVVPFNLQAARGHSSRLTRPLSEIDDYTGNSLSAGTGSLSNKQRFNPESHKPSQTDEIWKWEGTIAKGGTPVCRARCFPVGKVLDFMLPEILNCTAKTGLDMLAKHYYQAAGTWVVFFVPEGDADITLYNEFMHYLGEKQRVAVAKLDEKVTLFLVPPSDFSEQVLKVPGKVSISGVILKFHQTAANFHSLHHPVDATEPKVQSLQHPMDAREPKVSSVSLRPNEGLKYHEDKSFRMPNSPDFRFFSERQSYVGSSSGYLAPSVNFPSASKPDDNFPHSIPAPPREKLHEEKSPLPSNLSRYMPITSSVMGSFFPASNPPSQPFGNSFTEEFPSVNSKVSQGTDLSGYMPETIIRTANKIPPQQEVGPRDSSATFQPEQLAQLVAILGNTKQSGKEHPLTMDDSIRQSNMSQNPSSQSPPYMLYNNSLMPNAFGSVPPDNSSLASPAVGSQIAHGQQLHMQPPEGLPVQNFGQHFDRQVPDGSREDAEADPEKRLQATLQLAATLLQQIQQRSKIVDER